jgi:drug/metabolite transporter (DMT)-like permease
MPARPRTGTSTGTTAPAGPGAGWTATSRARAALALMAVIWGVNFPIAKAALDEMSPLAFNALRFPLAAATLWIALQLRGGSRWPDAADRLRILGLAVLGNVCYQQFFIFGLDNTRAGTASVLLAATPIITALLSATAGHEVVRTRTWIGVVATFAGIVILVLAGQAQPGESRLLGDVLMLAASCSWAFYTVGSRSLVAKYGAVQFTAWSLWAGAVMLFLVGLPAVLATDLAAISTGAWIGVIYAGALSIGVAYLIWYYGVNIIGNTGTAAYSNLVPVVALTAAWLQLGEVPHAGQVAGAAVIIAGVTLAQARVGRPARV